MRKSSQINKMINLIKINWCHSAKIMGSQYKLKGKIVGKN